MHNNIDYADRHMIRVCFQKMIRSISSTVRTFWETNICGRYLVQKYVWYVPNEANEFVWASYQHSTWIKPNGVNFQRKCIKCSICDSFQKFYAVDISSLVLTDFINVFESWMENLECNYHADTHLWHTAKRKWTQEQR